MKRSTASVGALVVSLWLAVSDAYAATTPEIQVPAVPDTRATEVASVEGITEYRLPNGLRFLLLPDPSRERITVNVTYLVGSRHEGYGETGMAHLLEHLLFLGSPGHPNVHQEFSERGASANGTTGFDRTNYYETFPASEGNLAWALDLESDRMVNAYLREEDLASEMTVVRNEWKVGKNYPSQVLMERVVSTAYLWHNYGNSTIGARADIENVPMDRLRGFYRKYYLPDNALLIVAGRFDPDAAIGLIEEKFGRIPRPDRSGANQLFETYTVEPPQDGERTVTLRRVGDVPAFIVAYHVPAGPDEGFAAVEILAELMRAQPTGRLYKQLVLPGLASTVYASAFQLSEPGLFIARAEVRKGGDLQAAAEAMLKTLHGVVEEPPTAEEIDRAKAEYAANFDLGFNDPQTVALNLSEWAGMGDWRLLFLHRDRVEEVTADDVLAAAKAYLLRSNRTLGYYYPTVETPRRAAIPAKPDVAALVANFGGREVLAAGEAFDPSPENIERRTTRLTLSSGTRVALLPKENRGESVTAVYTLRLGTEDALAGKATAGALAASMLSRGTTERSRQEIADEMDRLNVRGSLSGAATGVVGGATTVRENLPAFLRLIGELLRQPAFDPNEFELLRHERLEWLESRLSEPGELVPNAMQRYFGRGYETDHINYVPSIEEQIAREEAVSVDEAREFWASFYGADNGRIAIVGDFDASEIAPVLEEVFGGWRAREPYERIPRRFAPVQPTMVDLETPDKANAFMYAVQPLRMRDDHVDYPALVLANYMLGGGYLNARLPKRIRTEEGLSYGVGSELDVSPLEAVGSVTAYATFAPGDRDKVPCRLQRGDGASLD